MLQIQELKEFRDVGKKLDENKIKEVIQLAKLDLQNLIGFSFYNYVDSNKETLNDLLNGSDFEYNGLTVSHLGLKSILADLAYSRLMMQINVNITPFGSTIKDSQDSTPTDRKTLYELQNQAKIDASQKWDVVKKYVMCNSELKNAYKGYESDSGNSSYMPKIYKL